MKDSSWINEILQKFGEAEEYEGIRLARGNDYEIASRNFKLYKSEAKAAIEAELERIERLSFAKGYDQGCLDSQLSPKQKTKEWQHGYNSGWQKAGGRERAGINLKGGASDE